MGRSTTNEHNSFPDLQGGAAGDRQHLTSAELTAVQTLSSTLALYAKLDGSNQPFTGAIDINTSDATPFQVRNSGVIYLEQTDTLFNLYGGSKTYKMTSAPLRSGGVNYDFDFDEGGSFENAYFTPDLLGTRITGIVRGSEPVTVPDVDGTESIGVVAYDIDLGGGTHFYLTMYFPDSLFANAAAAESWMDGLSGATSTASEFQKSVFVQNGAGNDYTNSFGSLVLATNASYTDPPECTGFTSPAVEFELASGDLTTSFDFKGDNPSGNLWWQGQVNVGPNEDNPALAGYQMSVTGSFSGNSGIYVGLGFTAFLEPTAAASSALYGIFGGVLARGEYNITGNIGAANLSVLVQNTATMSNCYGMLGGYALQLDTPGQVSVCNSYKFTSFNFYDQYAGTGGSGSIGTVTMFEGADYAGLSGGNLTVGDYYGFKQVDNSSYVTGTSWGIYMENQCYWDCVFDASGSNGLKIGAATSDKLSFWNATTTTQPSSSGSTAGFTQGSGNNVQDVSTFTGGSGATGYTIDDIVLHLKTIGLIAA